MQIFLITLYCGILLSKITDEFFFNNLSNKYNLDFKYNFDLIPLNHQENIIYYIFEMASGEGLYLFKTEKDYYMFLEKIEIFPEMIYSIIEKFKKGIQANFVLPKLMCSKLIEQHNELIKSKSYLNKKLKYKLDYDFNKLVGEILIPSLKKLNKFLKDEYFKNCNSARLFFLQLSSK